MVTYRACKYCSKLIDISKHPYKFYCSNSCRQSAYNERKVRKEKVAKITLKRYCVNCGKPFETTTLRKQFCKVSCRVSFHQNRKRIEERFQAKYGDKTDG